MLNELIETPNSFSMHFSIKHVYGYYLIPTNKNKYVCKTNILSTELHTYKYAYKVVIINTQRHTYRV